MTPAMPPDLVGAEPSRPRVVAVDEWGRFAARELGIIAARKPWARIGAEGTSMSLVRDLFPDDCAVFSHMFRVRFGARPVCPTCLRMGNWVQIAQTSTYRASCCKRALLNVTTDTLFDRSRMSVVRWLDIMLLFANAKAGVSIDLTARLLGVTLRAAYRIINRIRWHVALLEADRAVGGDGEPVQVAFKMLRGVRTPGTPGGATATILLLNDSQHLVAHHVPDRRTATIHALVSRYVKPGSILVYPDETGYRRLSGYGHNKLIIRRFELQSGQSYPGLQNLSEGYWIALRRVMRSTHVHMQRDNVWKYVNEFSFRFNRVHRSHETFWDMICHFPPMPIVESKQG